MTGSGRARVPIKTALAGFVGIGIALAGGNANTVTKNRVARSERYGVAIFPTARFVDFFGRTRARAALAPEGQPRHPERRRRLGPGRSRARGGLGRSELLRREYLRQAFTPARAADAELQQRRVPRGTTR